MYQKHKTFTVDEAKKKLERYCGYQERCHQDVINKLKGMNMIPEAIDIVIVHLLEHNFLNEERFAKTYARGKFRIKKWGKRRITLELKKKGISKFNVNQALTEIDNSVYIEVFNDLAEKKALLLKEPNIFRKKKKLIDYLLYRGWKKEKPSKSIN